jgi:ATP-dependent phosphofructokinase / diphosphate-dependent phosphofructokinase
MSPRRARRVGLLTGGGDCPGLNAVIRAASRTAFHLGWEVWGIEDGFDGLLTRDVRRLTGRDVRGILQLGGTILGTTNRRNPFQYPVRKRGTIVEADRSGEVMRSFRALGLDALVAIGGDGTLGIAERFSRKGMPLVGVPKTIDNDIPATVVTFGFDTAVSTATDALDKLHTTAESHKRVMVVEVMGRYTGWIALQSGVSGGADVILIPEIPFDLEKVCDSIRARERAGREFSIVVVAEGAAIRYGRRLLRAPKEAGVEPRLGGVGAWLAQEIASRTGKETRELVLGHLQRGGQPTSFDRLLGTRFGAAAMRLVAEGRFGTMVALDPPKVRAVPLARAVGHGRMKKVPLDSDILQSARDMGIGFGD